MVKINIWKRKHPDSFDTSDHQHWIQKNSFKRRFSELEVNNYLDIYVKRIALKASPSVVSVEIYSGGKGICWGSGFIIECDTTANNQFQSTIITSATLLRTDATLNTLVDDLKVVVVLSDGKKCDGEIEAFDFHYNLAAIKIQGDRSLEIARLKHVDDLILVDPTKISTPEAKLFQLCPHSDLFKLVPGSRVIALGRYHDDETDIMVSPGIFSIEQCRFDCKELLRSTCRITKCGIGGPLINRNGELLDRDYCRPWLGMELSNLFTIEASIWEKIIQKFPNLKNGIVVDEVTPDSPAGSAEVHPDDIIVECDGFVVKSSLQFFDLTWDKVGKQVDLVLIRRSDCSRLNLSMTVADISPNQFNCWPLPGRG